MIVMNKLKKVDLSVPSLTFGGASIANLFKNLSNREALAVVEQAIETGFRYFDTAPHYGSGLSELRLGLGLRGLDKSQYILSTKVGRLLAPRKASGLEAGEFFFEENPRDRVYDYSYGGIMRSYEDSMQRLGVRGIDILYVHDIGTYTHGETAIEQEHFKTLCQSGFKALEELKANGDIKAFGVGANEQAVLMKVLDHASVDIFMLANRYNLLEPERIEFFDQCHKHDVSVSIAAPFATGVLVSGVQKAQALYEYGKVPQHIFDRVVEIETVCAKHNVPVGAVALQFPLRNAQVVSVTCGIQSVEQAKVNFDWAQIVIPDALWCDLAAIGIK